MQGDRIYSLYSIKTITSMESPHKTWKPNVCVCVCERTISLMYVKYHQRLFKRQSFLFWKGSVIPVNGYSNYIIPNTATQLSFTDTNQSAIFHYNKNWFCLMC